MLRKDKDQRLRSFANRLNEVCDEMGMPSAEGARAASLALLADVSRRAARFWLQGDNLPTPGTLERIAERGGVTIEWLRTGRGPKRAGASDQVEAGIDVEAARIVAVIGGVLAAYGLPSDALATPAQTRGRIVKALRQRDKAVRSRRVG